jgi:hypothetical protein
LALHGTISLASDEAVAMEDEANTSANDRSTIEKLNEAIGYFERSFDWNEALKEGWAQIFFLLMISFPLFN